VQLKIMAPQPAAAAALMALALAAGALDALGAGGSTHADHRAPALLLQLRGGGLHGPRGSADAPHGGGAPLARTEPRRPAAHGAPRPRPRARTTPCTAACERAVS